MGHFVDWLEQLNVEMMVVVRHSTAQGTPWTSGKQAPLHCILLQQQPQASRPTVGCSLHSVGSNIEGLRFAMMGSRVVGLQLAAIASTVEKSPRFSLPAHVYRMRKTVQLGRQTVLHLD